ncbi:MAG: PAS domain S-box protein [Candidatus Lokiarchaeota archaeon]|nr:PAS domain S-box protein [Candidatus Lokiarchaeota archaeon]
MNDEKNLDMNVINEIFNEIPLPSFVCKKIGKDVILHNYNKKAKVILDNNPGFLKGKSINDSLKAYPSIFENITRCLKKKTPLSQEMIYTQEQTNIEYNLHLKYIFIQQDFVLILLRRVKELKSLERKIKKTEEIYRYLFDYSISSMAFHEVVYDSNKKPINYKITDVNPMFEKVMSLKREEVIGKLITKVFHVEEPTNLEIYAKVAETLEPTSFVFYSDILNKYFKTSAFSFEKGSFITVFEDISDQIKAELKLIESEKKFRSIIENTSDAIVIVGFEANYLYVSPQFLELLGLLELDYNSSIFQTIHPKNLEKFKKIYSKCVEQKSVLSNKVYELRLQNSKKSVIWVSLASKNYYNDEGAVIGFINSIRDITERKEAEQKVIEYEKDLRKLNEELEQRVKDRTNELLESENKYREIIERNYDAYFEIDGHQKITFVNNRICQLLEYQMEEMLGLNVKDIIYPLHINRVVEKGKVLWEKELPQMIFEFDVLSKHGKQIPVETALYLKFDSKRKKTGFYGLSREINVIKLLRESEEKFLATSEQTFMGIAIYQDDRIKYANKALHDLTGYPFEESKNWDLKKIGEIIHPDDKDFVRNQYQKKKQGEPDHLSNYEFRIITKSGRVIWVDHYTNIITFNGKPAILTTYINIDEKKRAQEKIMESELKLREAFRLNEIYKDIFTHDINNILQNILTSVELNMHYLKHELDGKEQEFHLNLIKHQVRNGALLVSNVKRLSQIEQSSIDLETIDMIPILKVAIDFVLEQFQDRSINIEIKKECEDARVLASKLMLDIFQNLLFNSVKHNFQPDVKVTITITNQGVDNKEFVKLEFSDNGIGVEDVRKDEIFQREIKGDRSVSGIGFGLLLTKKIVELYCGKIWVEDRIKGDYSQGSKFVLLFPRAI